MEEKMRKTLTSFAALMLAFGTPAAVSAQEQDLAAPQQYQQRLTDAGFENVRILPGVEIARVTDDEGNRFFAVGGLHGGAGIGGAAGIAAEPLQDEALDHSATGAEPAAGETERAETTASGGDPLAPSVSETAGAEPADPAAPGATPGTGDPAEPPIADAGPATEPIPPDASAAGADPLAADRGEPGAPSAADPLARGVSETAEAESADPAAPGATPGTGDPTEPPIADAGPAIEPIPPDASAAGADSLAADRGEPSAHAAADPLAGQNLTEGAQSEMDFAANLEQQLAEFGIEDYELVHEAHVAEVTGTDGRVIYVILGIEDGGEES
jgi:hypothetical protein